MGESIENKNIINNNDRFLLVITLFVLSSVQLPSDALFNQHWFQSPFSMVDYVFHIYPSL